MSQNEESWDSDWRRKPLTTLSFCLSPLHRLSSNTTCNASLLTPLRWRHSGPRGLPLAFRLPPQRTWKDWGAKRRERIGEAKKVWGEERVVGGRGRSERNEEGKGAEGTKGYERWEGEWRKRRIIDALEDEGSSSILILTVAMPKSKPANPATRLIAWLCMLKNPEKPNEGRQFLKDFPSAS